jgi:uncharacterized membrane protein YgaE (UPF0421/DUF939 family)
MENTPEIEQNNFIEEVKTLYELMLPSLKEAGATPKELVEAMLKIKSNLSKQKKNRKNKELSPERQEIINFLKETALSPKEISILVNKNSGAVRKMMWKMKQDNQLKKVSFRNYTEINN